MSFWLILIPMASALMGWLFTRLAITLLFHPRQPVKVMGFQLQGLIPRRQSAFSISTGELVGEELFSFDEIEQKILHPEHLQQITPEIEKHIDHFLRVKLQEAMPMVAMFVGDRTINQLKEIFMTEMKTLFPVIMKSYVKKLEKNFDAKEMIIRKLQCIPAIKTEEFVLQIFRKELRYVQIAGAIFGFVMGSVQVLLTLFMTP